MRERDRLQSTGGLIEQKRKVKKDKRKAKIKAKVKIKVKKELEKYQTNLTVIFGRLTTLHNELLEYNPRFKPLQMHTKIQWTDDIGAILLAVQELIPKKE